jgi:hypothetical protein
MPQPNNEEIIRILAEYQLTTRQVLMSLIEHNATPYALSAVVQAMHQINDVLVPNDGIHMHGPRLLGGAVDPLTHKLDTIEKAIADIQQRLPRQEEITMLTK